MCRTCRVMLPSVQLFLLFVFFTILKPSGSLLNNYNELLRDYETKILKDGRIVIDDAITEKELAGLMKVVNSEYTLYKQENLSTVNDAGNVFKATVMDLPPLVGKPLDSMGHHKHEDKHEKNSILKGTNHDLMSVMLRVVNHAEAFFNQTVFMKSAAIFARRQIVVDDSREISPKGLNHAAGWLVPVHTDGCIFAETDWSCEAQSTPQAIEYYKGKDISVVIFLNDLSEKGGGELVFVDPLKKPSISQRDHHRRLGDEYSYEKRSLRRTASSIPPPDRQSIRRALSSQSVDGDAEVTKSVTILSE